VTDTSWCALIVPGHAGEERTAGEGEQLEPEDVDAHGLGGLLVLADRDPAAPDPAVVERVKIVMMIAATTSMRK
jgi:hypothetical protein